MSLPIAREILKSRPIAYWPLQELSGTTAYDIIGGRDGTYVNAPTLGAPGFPGIGKMVDFNGVTQYVTVPDDNIFSVNNTNQFSVEILLRPDAFTASTNVYPFSKAMTANHEWYVQLFGDATNSATAYANITQSAGGAHILANSTAGKLVPRSLYLFSWSVNLTTGFLSLFINGSLTATASGVSGVYTNNAATVRIGNRADNDSYFDGRIAHAAIYNRYVPGAEWRAHARALLGPIRRGRMAA